MSTSLNRDYSSKGYVKQKSHHSIPSCPCILCTIIFCALAFPNPRRLFHLVKSERTDEKEMKSRNLFIPLPL